MQMVQFLLMMTFIYTGSLSIQLAIQMKLNEFDKIYFTDECVRCEQLTCRWAPDSSNKKPKYTSHVPTHVSRGLTSASRVTDCCLSRPQREGEDED